MMREIADHELAQIYEETKKRLGKSTFTAQDEIEEAVRVAFEFGIIVGVIRTTLGSQK
jgi:hypothetical protein